MEITILHHLQVTLGLKDSDTGHRVRDLQRGIQNEINAELGTLHRIAQTSACTCIPMSIGSTQSIQTVGL